MQGRVIDSCDSDDLIDIPSVVPDDSPGNPAVVVKPTVESDESRYPERVCQRSSCYHDSVCT